MWLKYLVMTSSYYEGRKTNICNENEMVEVDEINQSVQDSILSIIPNSIKDLYFKISWPVWNFPSNLCKLLRFLYAMYVLCYIIFITYINPWSMFTFTQQWPCAFMKFFFTYAILSIKVLKLRNGLFILHK